ncbi:pyridoxal phosphate-dependent aminotransferase [Riemerella columbipharyngis]|uniref:Aspartate aminotransferase n=1 Tax=Riemerella columbipharyngis TaxID=1071918 RepID=A0A1G6YEE8_9FLAO|nr:aminotransferase class I/II-fold pyridoxal phosphate-dependent enzyme [Riemerella columbipharyngis]SDD88854.1 aspartate aminotransferase [Riemerella columbipharyngis]
MKLSHLATHLVASEIVKISNEVNDLKSKGRAISNLTIGDLNSNIYPIPALLKEAIQEAYNANFTNYPPSPGIAELREVVSKDIKERYDLDYPASDIQIAGGSRPLIYTTYLSIVDEGDKVVYPVPSWNNNHFCYLSDAQKVEVETKPENNFLPTAEELRGKLDGAVLLALCSPLNPTGTAYTEKQLKEICDLVLEENKRRSPDQKPLYLLYDQIYALLTFGGKHVSPVGIYPEMKKYTIYIDGISKCLAATGVRVGWAYGPTEVIAKIKAFLTHIGAWAPKPEQEATAKFWAKADAVDAFVADFKGKINHSLETLHQGIQSLKSKGFAVDSIKPMGALYLTVKMDYVGKTAPDGTVIKDTTDLVFYLINNADAAFVPFSAFGNGREMPWFRASAGGCSLEDIQNLLPKLEKALSQLK